MHRQDRHADRGARSGSSGSLDCRRRTARACCELAYLNSRFESGLRSPLDDAILEHEPASTSRAGRRSTRCRSTSSAAAFRCWSEREGRRLLVVKGAPEDVLRLCDALRGAGEPDAARRSTRPRARRAERRVRTARPRGLPRARRSPGARCRPTSAHATVDDETELVLRRLRRLPRSAEGRAPARRSQASRRNGVAVKVVTGDNEQVTRACLPRARHSRRRHAHRRRDRARSTTRRWPRAVEDDEPVLPRDAGAEEPDHPRAASAAAMSSAISATASTTRPRCTPPMSASRSTAPSTSPRRRPT